MDGLIISLVVGLLMIGSVMAVTMISGPRIAAEESPLGVTDYSDVEKVLEEIEVLIAFGDEEMAIKVLRKAQEMHGSNMKIAAKLSELKSQRS